MKVIFLDVDGVLNAIHTPSRVAGLRFVDDVLIERLQAVIHATGARVVLSSSWREGWREPPYPPHFDMRDLTLFEAFRAKLLEHGIELLDQTPFLGHRGAEISAWLEAWEGEPIDRYVVLDDLGGHELRPHGRYLIQTSMTAGLTEKHVKRAIRMLSNE